MFVAVLRLVLHLPGCRSLKEKRSVLRPVLEAARGRFDVSAAEVGAQDARDRAVLGFAVVSGSERGARVHLQRMERALCGEGAFRVLEREEWVCDGGSYGRAAPEPGLHAPGGWTQWEEES